MASNGRIGDGMKWLLSLIAAAFLMSVAVAWQLDQQHESIPAHQGAATLERVQQLEDRVIHDLDRQEVYLLELLRRTPSAEAAEEE